MIVYKINDMKMEENSGLLLLTYLLRDNHYLNIYKKNGSLEKTIVLNKVMPLKEGQLMGYLIGTKRKFLVQNYQLNSQMLTNTIHLDLITESTY